MISRSAGFRVQLGERRARWVAVTPSAGTVGRSAAIGADQPSVAGEERRP